MASHPLRPDERGTVVNWLVAQAFGLAQGHGARERGLVHRLDVGTSGTLLIAKTDDAFDAATGLLADGRIDKRYVALCAGAVDQRTVDGELVTDPRNARRVLVTDARGRRVTEILSVEPIGAYSLVEARAAIAGRHQVRAHLAAAGHPLVGDELYGGPPLTGLGRHFLHASRLAFEHPFRTGRVEASSELTPDLVEALDRCRRRA
jgi:23S rRNA pseudouridine1911/1915/1917 synthase